MSPKKSAHPREKDKNSASPKTAKHPSRENAPNCPVVAVGASSGGLNPLMEILTNLPQDTGMAYVLIQHLDPAHESRLAEILAGKSKMPVSEIQDHTPVQPDMVYVIPPDKDLYFEKSRLMLKPRDRQDAARKPIDIFFKSLAENNENLSIGVILSGVGTDGTEGLKAIKEKNGFSFAQDEESAKFTGMPHSAIAENCVDFVLTPQEIARELVRISRDSHNLQEFIDEQVLNKPDMLNIQKRILYKIFKATGVDFNNYKNSMISRRFRRRMILNKVSSLEEYEKFIAGHPEEIQNLYRDFLIQVTNFFRDPSVFDVLKKEIFPEIVKNKPRGNPIRVWVPGCSSGEEAYSIAIALLEFMEENQKNFPLQIFGTDILEESIEKARAGKFLPSIAEYVSRPRLLRFFNEDKTGYRIKKQVREVCIFARQDLLKDPPFSNLDLISCRNVLIYLDPSLQDRVMKLFHYGLNPEGFLLLGASENIKRSSDTFKPYDGKQRIYIKKQSAKHMLPVFPAFDEVTKESRPAGSPESPAFNLEEQINSIILNEYSPPGIVVNEDYEILQFIGQPLPFLHPSPGRASLNLTRMARKEMLVELRTAIYQAKKELQPVKREDVYLEDDQIKTKIRFEVVPLQNREQSETYYLILFRQVAAPETHSSTKIKARKKETDKSETDKDQEIRQLKKQLDVEREHLQKTIEQQEMMYEELRSTNEEILSSNEELQSTNEELDTAQEELKATNEELNIINAELQDKNEALAQSMNDLNNLLRSVQIPLVILGNDLRIRHFTPACGEALNIRPEDRGRLITSIKLKFELPELEKMVLQVLDKLHVTEKEIRDETGDWYKLQIRPYLTEEKKIEGAILSFMDIDVLKRSELAERRQKEDLFRLLEIYGNDMVYRYRLLPKRGYEYVSPTAQKITGYSDQEFYHQPDLMLKIVKKEDRELAKALFREETERGEPVRMRIVHKNGMALWTEHRTLSISDEEGKIVTIQGVVRDVQAEEELKETSGRLRKLSAHISDIKEEEGKRMARKIHDEIGQNLVGLKMNLSSLFAKTAEQPDYPRKEAEDTMAFIDSVLKSVQHITSELRPGILDDLGIFEAIDWYAKDFQKNSGVTCSVRIEKNTPKPQDNCGIGIFRILQEILSNVRRHSGASAVSISIFRKNGKFVMLVEDNGQGIKAEQMNSPASFGIQGMKERTHNMGGKIFFKGKEGKGTTVTLEIPVKNLEK